MKTLLSAISLLLFGGCLSVTQPPSVSYWLLEFRDSPAVAKTPKYGVVRLSQVIVNLPYASDRLVVLKKNGTVAFDDRNVFAASPALLARSVCLPALKSSGLFDDVVSASSGASSTVSLELVVTRFALDCRQEDSRQAVAEVLVRVLDGKKIVATVGGNGSVDASDGDYGVAFSKALSSAVSSALSKLR